MTDAPRMTPPVLPAQRLCPRGCDGYDREEDEHMCVYPDCVTTFDGKQIIVDTARGPCEHIWNLDDGLSVLRCLKCGGLP